jgi:hypothetical protein
MSFLPASLVRPQPIVWLWPNGLALGKLALLEGDPELGKTWVTCDLAARLSVGQLFPDGQPPPGPAATVILNGEDGSADRASRKRQRPEGSGDRSQESAIETQQSKIENQIFRWLGPTFWSADELASQRLGRAGKRAQARHFVRDFLQAGSRAAPEVFAAAREQGIAKRPLERAVQELELQTRRVIFPGRRPVNYWLLPGQALPATIPDDWVAPAW